MRIVLIAAVAKNGAIGAQGDLPWHLPHDLAFFYRQIEGCLLLSGRRSYDSPQGRVMFTPERQVIVVTRQTYFEAPSNVHRAPSIADAIRWAEDSGAPKICVLGGAEVYRETMGIADELILTEVKTTVPDADRFFPHIDLTLWKEVWREEYLRDEENPLDYAFVKYERV